MHKIRVLYPALFAVLLSAASGVCYAQKAPDWTLKYADGESVSLSDFRGKPVLLHFWATWCPYCKRLQPGLNQLYTKYHDQGLEIIGISYREEDGAMPQAVLDERGIVFPTAVNGEDVAASYGVKGTPTNVFIDRQGNITKVIADSDPENPEFEAGVLAIIAEQ
jgi:cytochrome c biogenesis protein CcmG/thiol:disulfide interchange protein DsbE